MENKKLTVVRQIVEQGFGNADLNVIDKLVSDSNIEHQFMMKGGKEGLKKSISGLANAFTDRKYELLNHTVVDDIVWVHYRYTATHTGKFMGKDPTGISFTIDVMDIARVQNDQVVEHWGIPDRFAVLMQLGIFQPLPVTSKQ